MKTNRLFLPVLVLIVLINSCKNDSSQFRTIKPDVLKDKIAGGWAGKMIGVTYGAPTEFRARQKIYEDSILWKLRWTDPIEQEYYPGSILVQSPESASW